jgi:pimeloyl-ACP methyl ester carboxylesterase
MPKVRINGCMIHYQQMGEGHDLVLIHGLLGNLAFWYFSVLPLLMQDFRVCVYDMRGHGQSEMPQSGYRSADMAEDLRGLLDHLSIEQAHIAGHSFGGAVALHYATHYPERVLSLTLADAWVPGLQSPFPRRGSAYWKLWRLRLQRAGVLLPEALPIVAYAIFDELSRNPTPQGYGGLAHLRRLPDFSKSVSKHWSDLATTTFLPTEVCEVSDLTGDRIREISKPVLAIFGQYSNCLPTLNGLKKNLSNCKIAIIPGVGHFYPILQPDAFAHNLRRFALRSLDWSSI